MKCQADDGWTPGFSQTTPPPHRTSWVWMSPHGSHGQAWSCAPLSSVRFETLETYPEWHHPFSLVTCKKKKYLSFLMKNFWLLYFDRYASRKAGSRPRHWLRFLSHNDAQGILNGAFKPGKSIKLSAVAKRWESAVHNHTCLILHTLCNDGSIVRAH